MAKKRKRAAKPSKPVDLYVNAYSFRASSIALGSQPEKHLFFWPMVVNEAFALELYLKCLHRLRRRNLFGHDAQQLFSKLSRTDRNCITVRYNSIVKEHPLYGAFSKMGALLDIDSVLMRSRDAFPTIRYWHERIAPSRDSKGQSSNAGVGSLCDAIMLYLVELQPSWAQMAIRVPVRWDTERAKAIE